MAQTEKGIIYPYDYNEVADVPSDFKALAESIDRILSDYSLNTDSGNKIVLEMNNTTYKIKAVLKDKDDNVISTSNEIDLPLENMVTNISYNNQTLILTHQDGQTTEVSIADLISNLASKEEVSELQSQVDDLTTLVETELESNEVEGTEIDVSDSAEYPGKIIPGANLEQKQLSGKNLFGISDYEKTYNGVQIKIKDGEITLNGTCTGTGTVYIGPKDEQILNGTYTISRNSISGTMSGSGNVNLRNVSDDSIISGTQMSLTINSRTFTLENANVEYGIYLMKDSTFDNYKFRPQLVEGDTPDYDFEPYCGGQPSPNPDYPQSIKVVTGDNVVKHVGKNEFYGVDLGLWYSGNSNLFNQLSGFKSLICKVKPNTQYTISKKNVSNRFVLITSEDKPRGSLPYTRLLIVDNNRTNYTFTTLSNENYIFLGVYSGTDTEEIAKAIEEIQLEEGTTATPYEPYRGESFEVNLGKNLFDKNNANIINAGISSNKISISQYNRVLYIPIQPSTTYTVQKRNDGDVNRFRVGSCTVIPADNVSVSNSIENDNATNITITTGANDKYLAVMYYRTYETVLTEQQILSSIQIEKGATATSYSEYFTPIELCKIGDYQDILFKNVVGDENYNAELEEGAWYKKQLIGKFNDAQQLTSASVNENYFEMYTPTLNVEAGLNSSVLRNIAISNVVQSYPTNYSGLNGSTSTAKIRVRLSIDYATSHTEMKDYLIAKNFCIYYVQNSPTYEKITNPTLISQLEALKKAKWYKGVNNWWTETANLEPVLKGTYKQSNNLKNKERDERLDNLESRLALLE